ncbi:hypothetical protein BJX68DRAFT_244583 [Aspergillus pseudodeflectus]|uniref:Uncharacterized protein n=1 Tax=Aspergillus pseudodeflectus TaxID=176178 RepID=A0ABR4JRF0_9EURO
MWRGVMELNSAPTVFQSSRQSWSASMSPPMSRSIWNLIALLAMAAFHRRVSSMGRVQFGERFRWMLPRIARRGNLW